MVIQKVNSNPSFSGMLSAGTIKGFAEALGDDGVAMAKKFRAGKNKHDKINVIYDNYPLYDQYRGKVMQTDTYIQVANTFGKKPPIRVKLAKGKLPYGQEMLDVIAEKMNFVDLLKGKLKSK